MTQDEIIRMAREAGMTVFVIESLERFAALVAQNYMAKACGGCVIKQCYKRMDAEIEAAVLAEREACAKVCEAEQFPEIEDESCELYNIGCLHSAAAIRARGKE